MKEFDNEGVSTTPFGSGIPKREPSWHAWQVTQQT
jgi:hypothetical protein